MSSGAPAPARPPFPEEWEDARRYQYVSQARDVLYAMVALIGSMAALVGVVWGIVWLLDKVWSWIA